MDKQCHEHCYKQPKLIIIVDLMIMRVAAVIIPVMTSLDILKGTATVKGPVKGMKFRQCCGMREALKKVYVYNMHIMQMNGVHATPNDAQQPVKLVNVVVV